MVKGQIDVDGFIKNVQELTREHRVKEVIDYISGHNKEANFRQFRVLCMYNLAGIWVEEAGNGEKAREQLFEALHFIEADRSMITEIPSLQEVMEDMYIKLCELIADLAISYEEYEQHMAKIPTVRPYTQLQKGQMELIESMKNEGQPWVTNIMLLAQRYVGGSGDGQGGDRYGNAAALYELVLVNRRVLRPQRSDLKIAAMNYAAFIFNLVQRDLNYCHTTKTPSNPDNYLFILDKGISVLEESRRDVGDPQTTDQGIADLNRVKEELVNMKEKMEADGFDASKMKGMVGTGVLGGYEEAFGGQGPMDMPDPFDGMGEMTPEQMEKAGRGMSASFLVVGIIFLALAIFLWYRGIVVFEGSWWRILLAVICSIVTIGNFAFFGASRANRRR